MLKRWGLLVAAAVVMSLASGAWAQQPGGAVGQGQPGQRGMPGQPGPGGPGGQPGPGMGPGRMMGPAGGGGEPSAEGPLLSLLLLNRDALRLTDEQEKKLRSIRADYVKDAARRVADVRVGEVELGELLAAETPDLAKVEAEVKKIAAMQGEMRFRSIQATQASLAVLTKEQRQEFDRQVRQMAIGRMRGGMGPGGQPGPSMGSGGMMMGPGGRGSQPAPGMAPGRPAPGGGQSAPPAGQGAPSEHQH